MKTDAALRDDVLNELFWDPLVPASRLDVIVNDGSVTVIGLLDTVAQKVAVINAVARVDGVIKTLMELEVTPPGAFPGMQTVEGDGGPTDWAVFEAVVLERGKAS